jgi:hypothetical protein
MCTVKVIAGRILTANEKSPIAVESIDGKLRSYFYSTVKAPANAIENEKDATLMPRRENKNQLGVFHGAIGAANFKKMCFDLGIRY